MGCDPEAGGEAKHCTGVLRDIGLVEGERDHAWTEARPSRIVKQGRVPGGRSEG
jgi:hypothetical protein